jgi:hypothetical protein
MNFTSMRRGTAVDGLCANGSGSLHWLTAECAPLCLVLLGALSCPMGMSFYVGTVSQRGRGIAQRPYPWPCTADVPDNQTVATARPTQDPDESERQAINRALFLLSSVRIQETGCAGGARSMGCGLDCEFTDCFDRT